MMSRASFVSVSYVWMSFCIGVCAMIPSYNIRTRCNATIDMKTEKFHLGQIVFDMPWFGTTIKTRQTCSIVIVPWFSKPNIQFYFSKLSLSSCYNRLEIQKSTNGNVFTYPRDFYGSICRSGVSKSLLNEVYTVTGSYLRIKFTWSRHTSFKTSFKLIFNSYGTGSCYSTNEHLCDNDRCIMKNITCEKYNTCGDQSDCSRPTVYNWKTTGKGKSTIVLTVVSGIILFCVSCCIVSRFRKNSRLGMCMGRVCDCICDFKSRFVDAGRACMSGIGRGVSTCMSSIRRLPRSCRNYFREKCSTCEFRRRPEEETSTPQRPLPSPPQPQPSEPVNRTQIFMSSIFNSNEYDDLGEDPPPPYPDVEELPPPPHYEEVVRQPSKYMKN